MSQEFTEEEIAELEASLHEQLMQIDPPPPSHPSSSTKCMWHTPPGMHQDSSHNATATMSQNYFDYEMSYWHWQAHQDIIKQPDGCDVTEDEPPEIYFEDDLYAYDYFLPQNGKNQDDSRLLKQQFSHGLPAEDAFYFYYDGPQEDPYAAATATAPSSTHPNVSHPAAPLYFDKEAYYYDLAGNLIYKPPAHEPDLLEQLTQLNLRLGSDSTSAAASTPQSSHPNGRAAPTSHCLAGSPTALNASQSMAGSPRKEKCRYDLQCHAGVNCPFAHSPPNK
jgi:hypothetical protein